MTLKKSAYFRHKSLIRKHGRCDALTPKRFPCGHPECHERLGTVEKLREHMFQVHCAPTDIKRKVFENEAQFDEFLCELKNRGGNFRKSRGKKTIKEGTVQYFRCNRIFPIAKDKVMRIVDDINAGNYEAVKDITQPMDPFGKETSTKPHIRTEESCTAFLKKTNLSDGTIEVRYCDYHLHGDVRLRLPEAVRNRIHEMSKKKLPWPVIVMVLHRECHRFCMPGTPLEKRIMAVTPREVQEVAQSIQRRLDAAANRKKAAEASGQPKTSNGSQQLLINNNGSEDHKAAENLVNRNDDNDCQEHLEPADEIPEECAEGGEGVDYSTEGRGEGGELTELELTMLEEYERNRGVILTDFQSLKREENRKRLCRERVRARIYTLGRAMRNIQFSDFEYDLLVRSEQMLEAVVELWNARMEAGSRNDSANLSQKDSTYSDSTRGSSSEVSVEQKEISAAARDKCDNITQMESPITETENASDSLSKPIFDAGSFTPTSTSSGKRVVKTRPRHVLRSGNSLKEESVSLTVKAPSSQAEPAVTRLGRVIKRRKIIDV
ncbi:hypothetical protein KIN20_032471 [Parelaphostrongylus tenuis]|uniref:C2H2-type domain-containing protein n=1 Tax=Parelaphostrongylus tenuis TaxID=148309 RepID=A0AAD5WHI8_PARTN|nr:hypothetical protein KIN20_032471 [Parelaphostrongylus tenuis]